MLDLVLISHAVNETAYSHNLRLQIFQEDSEVPSLDAWQWVQLFYRNRVTDKLQFLCE